VESIDRVRSLFLDAFQWTDGHADFARVFRSSELISELGPAMVSPFRRSEITAVVGTEARGFVLGALCASALGVGLVLARKPGSVHPGANATTTSDPDWRGRRVTFEISRILGPYDRVLVVDDWIETGSQADAVRRAIDLCGATFVGTSVIVDQTTPAKRALLRVTSLVQANDLPPSA
jgi:adenine phosphoribosyltransferase